MWSASKHIRESAGAQGGIIGQMTDAAECAYLYINGTEQQGWNYKAGGLLLLICEDQEQRKNELWLQELRIDPAMESVRRSFFVGAHSSLRPLGQHLTALLRDEKISVFRGDQWFTASMLKLT